METEAKRKSATSEVNGKIICTELSLADTVMVCMLAGTTLSCFAILDIFSWTRVRRFVTFSYHSRITSF